MRNSSKYILFTAVFAFWTMLISSCSQGFGQPQTPRAQARNVVYALAIATRTVRESCYEVAEARFEKDPGGALELAQRCQLLTEPVRNAIKVAALAVDAWKTSAEQDGALSKVGCAAGMFAKLYPELEALFKELGVDLPGVIADAMDVAKSAARECREPMSGG